MDIKVTEINGVGIAEIIANAIVIKNEQDAVELIANCGYNGAYKIIVQEANITPDFFELKTRIAGDVLQKFSTYDAQLAIVGDFAKYDSKSLNDFMYESNKTGRIYFVGTVDEARERLLK